MRQIIKNEGYLGVYKGVVPTMMKSGTNQGIRFMTYEEYKAIFRVFI